MTLITFLAIFVLLPFACDATDLKPWFTNDCEVELGALVLYQNYSSIHTSSHSSRYDKCHRDCHCHSILRDTRRQSMVNKTQNDAFATLRAEYPFRKYCAEFEATLASTHRQSGTFDNFRLTGRYQWLAQVNGDPFALTSGITFTQPMSRALHDVSSFHHGHFEIEFHLSYGKEYGYQCNGAYQFRWWNVLKVGCADEGNPWYQGDAAWECTFNDNHAFRGFVNLFLGGGNYPLHPIHFKGYGCVKYRALDLGIRYEYSLDWWGILSLQYARRVYAYNFPANTNLLFFEYRLPFGTQEPYHY